MDLAVPHAERSDHERTRSPLGRVVLNGTVGFVTTFVVAVAIVGVTWLIVFARAIAGQPTLDVPGFITVVEHGTSVSTLIGPLAVLGPLIVAVAGAGIAIAVGGLVARSARARGHHPGRAR